MMSFGTGGISIGVPAIGPATIGSDPSDSGIAAATGTAGALPDEPVGAAVGRVGDTVPHRAHLRAMTSPPSDSTASSIPPHPHTVAPMPASLPASRSFVPASRVPPSVAVPLAEIFY